MKNISFKIIKYKKQNEINEVKKALVKVEEYDDKNFTKLCTQSIKSITKNKKIILFGNGGSASDAQHLATELTVRYKKNRKPIAAISLATDTSALTAIGNDFDFSKIFSRQIEAIAQNGDIAIAITTSGNSKNIIEAAKMCKRKKVLFFAFCGNNGGKLIKFTKNIIKFPEASTSVTQVMQIMIGQIYCDILESSLKD